ncbi:MAG: kinase to dihydroxyacetone kinase [Bacilli bacterium]
MSEKLEFKFDTQLLINGTGLNEDEINKYITEHFKGDCLIAVGDDTLIKIHFHTNEPWQILEYAQSIGDISDVVVENMQRQSDGLKG